jgi:isopentenyl-diphosphate Delta-isomerase
MTSNSAISHRKREHLDVVLQGNGDLFEHVFDSIKLPYMSLPEYNLEDIDLSTEFLNYRLNFPFLISSMTWGTPEAKEININLAKAAERNKVALSLGSMKICLKEEWAYETFDIKQYCPNVPLIANIGLVQLNYGITADHINTMTKRIQADAIFLHINPLQEAVQPWWDVNFHNLLPKLKELIPQIHIPVLIKECGNGIDPITAQKLVDCWVKRIDVSGKWWTSRPMVENKRRTDGLWDPIIHLGISTKDSILMNKDISWLQMIAWWGIRDGIDVLKSIYLGAKISTAASPFLKPATISDEEVSKLLSVRERQCKIGLRSMGHKSIQELHW